MTVVDASVAVKWFAEEPDSAAAKIILAAEEPLFAPAHLRVEAGRGLLRRKRAGDMSAEDAKLALAGLPAILRLSPLDQLAPLAFDIADETSVTIYDALYVALAEQLDDILITADLRLCRNLETTAWARRVKRLHRRSDATPQQREIE